MEVHVRKAKLMVMPLSVVLVLLGCNLFVPSSGTVSGGEIAAFQKVFMSSYYADRGGRPGGARAMTPFFSTGGSGVPGRTTVPVLLLTNYSFANPSPNPIVNYPEPGETTSFTITLTGNDPPHHVYDVVVTTTYPAGDIRKNYVEEYYVRDIGKNASGYYDPATPDGLWTVDDPIVSNATGPWLQDQKARVKQVLTFVDGSTRAEHIVSQTDFATVPSLPKFPAFDVNGSLTFGQLFIPGTDANAVFSSVVTYNVTPSTTSGFWFWQGSQAQNILGIRYYTEFKDGSHYYTYTIAFEKTLSTLSTTGLSTPAIWQTVFVGSQYDTLAESVLRQQVTFTLDGAGNPNLSTGVVTTNMQTRVVNITGLKDFYLQQLNTDYVNLSSWDTTTAYTPTGSAAEILAGDPTKFLYGRTLAGAGGQPLAVATTAGMGDLAQLYNSIVTGAVSLGTTTVTSPLIGNSSLNFDGTNRGSEFSGGGYDLSPAGTIEAWIYVKQHTDTGGIVHKGVNPNFTDECYSLQFWGNQGQVALALDGPGGGSNYDLLTSTINLNTGRWYYLTATWDRAASPQFMKLYINGVLNARRVPTVSGSPQVNTSDLLIGSQLPSTYSPAYGYFSLNGAIAGVTLSNSALDATTVLAQYNAQVGNTGSWPHP